MKQLQQYDFHEQNAFADKGVHHVTQILHMIPDVIGVLSVEKTKAFQDKDIDLIVVRADNEANVLTSTIEVKTDSTKSRNIFIETMSNLEQGTEGCFMVSQADYWYYYFIQTGDLYVLPLEKTRQWFLDNISRFKVKRTTTPIGISHYTSEGYIVPKHMFPREVDGVTHMNIKKFLKED